MDVDEWGYVEFLTFLAEQGDASDEAAVQALWEGASKGRGKMSAEDLHEYLFSHANAALDPCHEHVCMDMSRPLTEYFIESSHNTCVWRATSCPASSQSHACMLMGDL